ncbi:MAG TPA: hypothetical protein VMM80_02230, partial [Bacteroidota bacterium]|nr:hypothetical protein [Bacteroidota bacterium]
NISKNIRRSRFNQGDPLTFITPPRSVPSPQHAVTHDDLAQYIAFYSAVVNGKNSGNWGPPGQIRFGARLDL